MPITIHLYYYGQGAKNFAEEMEERGIASRIRATEGNLSYRYFEPLDDPNLILLIDQWEDQSALDRHHASQAIQEIMELREKYDLRMEVHRFIPDPSGQDDRAFIRE